MDHAVHFSCFKHDAQLLSALVTLYIQRALNARIYKLIQCRVPVILMRNSSEVHQRSVSLASQFSYTLCSPYAPSKLMWLPDGTRFWRAELHILLAQGLARVARTSIPHLILKNKAIVSELIPWVEHCCYKRCLPLLKTDLVDWNGKNLRGK